VTFEDIQEEVSAVNEEALFADGFEEALIGYVEHFGLQGQVVVALYDRERCIKILTGDGMSYDEAVEYFDFNTIGAYFGPNTPAFATLIR